jgi:hypothetical protein
MKATKSHKAHAAQVKNKLALRLCPTRGKEMLGISLIARRFVE